MTAVSVGLPVFNGQRFLRACLDSLLAQSYQDFELIVSDNASTDATPRIVEEYARRDGRIRFERADRNQGAAWNHRHVLARAGGRYFKWCGADDLCHPEFLQACVVALERNPDAVLAFPKTQVIDETGEPVARTSEHLPVDSPDVVERFAALMSAWSITHSPWYGLVRRAALHRVRPMGAYLASDRCLLGELSLLGPFVEIPAYLLYRRWHPGNDRSQTEEQRLHDPAQASRFRTREWRVLREHLRAIAQAPVWIPTKLRLLARVAAWAVKERADLAAEGRGLVRRALGLARRTV